jgi:hypothetical protein
MPELAVAREVSQKTCIRALRATLANQVFIWGTKSGPLFIRGVNRCLKGRTLVRWPWLDFRRWQR